MGRWWSWSFCTLLVGIYEHVKLRTRNDSVVPLWGCDIYGRGLLWVLYQRLVHYTCSGVLDHRSCLSWLWPHLYYPYGNKEIDTSYFHNLIVQWCTTPFTSWWWCHWRRRDNWEKLGSVFPPILAVFISVLCILCFAAPSWNSPGGVIYIVGFRSRWFRRGEQSCKRVHEGEVGAHHMARGGACVVPPLSCLVDLLVDLFFSRSSISWKMMWQKDWVRLTSERSLKLKNMQRRGFLYCGFKTKKGDCLENPLNQWKACPWHQ
jgi:hypothetical protein